MLERALVENGYLWAATWVVLYSSDYYLTVLTSHLYHKHHEGRFSIKGGIELTPFFQRDIDQRRLVSLRFLLVLALTTALLYCLWWLSTGPGQLNMQRAFSFALGALFLQATVANMRHVENIAVWRLYRDLPRGETTVQYPRWVALRHSAVQRFTFAALFGALFLVTSSWFVLGGAAGCLVLGSRQWRGSVAHARRSAEADAASRTPAKADQSPER